MSRIILGDCLQKLKTLPDNSVDSIVTDPPYGLAFMGKRWDYDVPSVDVWRECLRVLKPGGHLLSFGGTRTYHRLVVNIEDAGFEVRDTIAWLYGQGFPKSLDISKAIDKAAGAEREVIGTKDVGPDIRGNNFKNAEGRMVADITKPATDLAKKWAGWGTALKPALEPICVARKPLDGTVAQNVEKWGVGGLNIDGCRVATDDVLSIGAGKSKTYGQASSGKNPGAQNSLGRFPANLLLDEIAAAMLDEQTGEKQPVSRFFYVAKASKKDRGKGNTHPTVKPTALMEYLVRLVTPPGGTVLDPFMGSGTTGVAALNQDFVFIGIEMTAEYFEIARKRIENAGDAA